MSSGSESAPGPARAPGPGPARAAGLGDYSTVTVTEQVPGPASHHPGGPGGGGPPRPARRRLSDDLILQPGNQPGSRGFGLDDSRSGLGMPVTRSCISYPRPRVSLAAAPGLGPGPGPD